MHHTASMRRRQLRILQRMRGVPTPTNIRWAEVVSLLSAMGVDIVERAGSRVQLAKGSQSMVVHRPHPGPEVTRHTIRDIVRFVECIEAD